MKEQNNYQLPSNFCRHYNTTVEFSIVPIVSKRNWVTQVRLPFELRTEEFFHNYISQNQIKKILFDGCNPQIKRLLSKYGFESLLVGQEALLDLSNNHFSKKSVELLIKRGRRHGKVIEIPYSDQAKKQVEEFEKISVIANSPKLQHLFCSTFEKFTRLFVFIDKADNWLGLITLSHNSTDTIQTELILRKSKHPVGIMEVLIFEIFSTLKKEEKKYWSLGAVPFVIVQPFAFSKAWLINFIGRRLRFAYNYKGLFNFKNKFMPAWIDYYICYNKKITFLELAHLMKKTNLLPLVLHKIFLKLWNAR